MQHDAWFFIGVFVFIFLIWIATGGPLHPIAFTGPRLAQPDVLGGGTYLSLPRAPYGVGGTAVVLPGSSSGGSSYYGNSGTAIPSSIEGIAFGPSSPYRDIVSVSHYISGAGSTNPKDEYMQISVGQNAGAPINISGWRFVSEATNNVGVIPKGTELPISGVVNPMQDITLSPGERATVISGRSPIGTSFRENKCIGYLSTFQRFSPSLPQNCPAPSDELALFYGSYYIRDEDCIEEVRKFSRCETILDPSTEVSHACQNFMEKYLNYNGCVAAHKNDVDFEGDTWRIYLGAYGSLWRSKYEVIKFVDTQGRTIDAFSY